MIDDEGISKAKIPQFDRSIKPAVTPLNEQNIQRDFSPIPGCSVIALLLIFSIKFC